jgi:hypothetical protein
MMQTDVKSANLNQSGFFATDSAPLRCRLKQATYIPNGGNIGSLFLFDTDVAPTTATYARSGNTVTVTVSAGHGLTTGTSVGLGFLGGTGGSATDGNYIITVTGTTTFTVTDYNSGTITAAPTCYYVAGTTTSGYLRRWVTALDTITGQTSTQQILIPGEGVLCNIGIYAQMVYIPAVTIFYG